MNFVDDFRSQLNYGDHAVSRDMTIMHDYMKGEIPLEVTLRRIAKNNHMTIDWKQLTEEVKQDMAEWLGGLGYEQRKRIL